MRNEFMKFYFVGESVPRDPGEGTGPSGTILLSYI